MVEQLLVTQGLRLITNLCKTMHNRLLTLSDKLLLRKHATIETINDQLKNICQIEHSRHCSPINFLVHLLLTVRGLIVSDSAIFRSVWPVASRHRTPRSQ